MKFSPDSYNRKQAEKFQKAAQAPNLRKNRRGGPASTGRKIQKIVDGIDDSPKGLLKLAVSNLFGDKSKKRKGKSGKR